MSVFFVHILSSYDLDTSAFHVRINGRFQIYLIKLWSQCCVLLISCVTEIYDFFCGERANEFMLQINYVES